MLWGIILVLGAIALAFWGYTLPRRRSKTSKEEDIVAFYLDRAPYVPAALWSLGVALALFIAGIVLLARSF